MFDLCCRYIDTFTFNAGMPVAMRGQDASQMKTIDVHFSMSHVNGYTFRLQPNRKFTGLSAGASETLRITGGGWAVSRSEVRGSLGGHEKVIKKYKCNKAK